MSFYKRMRWLIAGTPLNAAMASTVDPEMKDLWGRSLDMDPTSRRDQEYFARVVESFQKEVSASPREELPQDPSSSPEPQTPADPASSPRDPGSPPSETDLPTLAPLGEGPEGCTRPPSPEGHSDPKVSP